MQLTANEHRCQHARVLKPEHQPRPRHWLSQKTYRVMKLTAALLFAFSLHVCAVGVSQTVSFKGRNVSLQKVFSSIKQQVGYVVFYNYDLLENAKPVSIDVKDLPLTEFLERLLKNQPFDFIIKEQNIVITPKPKVSAAVPGVTEETETPEAPPVDLSGRVVNSLGAPMSGVSVTIKGTTTGTLTDDNGRYRLYIPADITEKIVVFSYVDHVPQEVRVTASGTVNITLESTDKSMGEIVVVGYSSLRKESVSGSVGTVSAEELTDVASPNIANLLQGKVAGVDVVVGGGKPGRLPNISIRGRASISTGLAPLWVVDGVIMPEDPNLNPNDVESVSVLKDASAASLYGSRGANGVIVVTTKMGKGNNRQDLTVSTKISVGKYNLGNFDVMNSRQLVDFYKTFTNPGSIPSWFHDSLANIDTDWIALGTQDGWGREFNIGYSGGSERAKIYGAANYFREDGTVKGYTYERYSGRLNLDYLLTDKLTFSPKVSVTYNNVDNRSANGYYMTTNLPWDRPYDPEGKPINPVAPGVTWYGRDRQNWLYDQQWNYTKENVFNIIANMDLRYQFNKNFGFRSTNNVSFNYLDNLIYGDPNSQSSTAERGRVNKTFRKRFTKFFNQMLTYTGKTGLHQVDALAAYEYNDFRADDIQAIGTGIVPGITALSGTATPFDINGNPVEFAFRSYLANVNYGYDENRFVAQASFRRDGSSRFGSNKKFGNFWSVSGAWNIHREAFFNSSTINYLRLKAAYGGVGNTPNDYYPQYDLYSVNAQYNGSPTAFPTTLGNADLTWEKTYSTNVGFDIGLFNRIDLSVELYDKNTSELLYNVPLPSVTGFTNKWENIGAVSNKGIEITLGGNVIQTTDITWRIDVNIGAYRNRITELYKGNSQIAGLFRYAVGSDINTWFVRRWAGVDPTNGDPQWEIVDPNTKEVTLTNNYSAATLQESGTTTPDYYGGINTTFSYKSLSLRANFAFRQGSLILHENRFSWDSDGAYPTYNQRVPAKGTVRWAPGVTNATHPAAVYGGNKNAHNYSTRLLEDGSFFRMRNITLAYSLPEAWMSKIKLKGIDAFVSADNLFILTDFSGVDPETLTFTDPTEPYGYYPIPRRVTFGVNIRL